MDTNPAPLRPNHHERTRSPTPTPQRIGAGGFVFIGGRRSGDLCSSVDQWNEQSLPRAAAFRQRRAQSAYARASVNAAAAAMAAAVRT
jgi:hypothetical protein